MEERSTAAGTPLRGLQVVEVSSYVASPLCGLVLAQLGADVVRVDPIGGRADHQRWPLAPNGSSLYWAELNRGKRSICVDLRSPDGVAVVRELVADAGTLVTNAGPTPGLGYEDLREVRPDLLMVQLLGGSRGSPAVDYTVNARVGFAAVTGPSQLRTPVNHVLPTWDVTAGLYLALGLLAWDSRRARTGEGAEITLALEDVALVTASNLALLAEAQLVDRPRGRIGNDVYGDFGVTIESGDGTSFMLVSLTPGHWASLIETFAIAKAIHALETALGLNFLEARTRYEYRGVITSLVKPWFAARDAPTVERDLTGVKFLWSRFRTFAEVVADPALPDNRSFARVSEPGLGTYLAAGPPLRNGSGPTPPLPTARLGYDTHQVLREVLGMSNTRLDDLARRGVIEPEAIRGQH